VLGHLVSNKVCLIDFKTINSFLLPNGQQARIGGQQGRMKARDEKRCIEKGSQVNLLVIFTPPPLPLHFPLMSPAIAVGDLYGTIDVTTSHKFHENIFRDFHQRSCGILFESVATPVDLFCNTSKEELITNASF